MNVNINDLKIFLSVCKTRSITQAAVVCDTSPSTVSRRVKVLEKDLGIKLIQKAGSVIRITPDGVSFKSTARQIVNKLEYSIEQLSCKRTELKGTVKLGVSHSFSRTLCASVIPRILDEQPDIEIDVITINPSLTYTMGDFDILITPMEIQDQSLIARKLVTLRKYFVSSRAYLSANGGIPAHPGQLGQYAGINNNSSRHYEVESNCSWTTENGQDGHCQVGCRVSVDSFDLAATLTEKGRCISLLPAESIRLLQADKCTVLFEGKVYKEQNIYIAYRDREYITERLRYIISELFSFIDETPGIVSLSPEEICAYG
ncbi:LysR family transcriptional regulator [Vibrio salinus]|uniref:LysR family transcriptional regulator n=1 Tax=Vibrio salinus TaxID=2899784 RepID=UPI001E29D5AE|nr:LysR family transcriptional regulator [Vibrio salinus]MCE0495191.1 LysR family transcriptional regulator [Vibrio salinus]